MGALGAVELWRLLVEELEAGGPLSGYDYRHDLGSRGAIARAVLPGLAAGEPEWQIIEELDERFKSLTVVSDRPIERQATPDQWWLWRVPRSARDGDDYDSLIAEIL